MTMRLIGYVTSALHPSFLSCGIHNRSVLSSTTTSNATNSSLYSGEIVGDVEAGRTASTLSRIARGAFIFSPTILLADSAPFSSMKISSIFSRFRASCHAALFAIMRVDDVNNVSTTRKLFARRLSPVSVTSTIASTKFPRALSSVAPQLNSTDTDTPRSAKNRRVVCTNSELITPPSRSSTHCTGESFGTASTHRTQPSLTLE
mmetsp:Transcript_11338/g.24426  ORF Transcript_11338/g.24426 Transcript_11338/m.24426 type:complete len:204 (-) Transcript_11338:557-1168(-)